MRTLPTLTNISTMTPVGVDGTVRFKRGVIKYLELMSRVIDGRLSFGNAAPAVDVPYKDLSQNLDGVWVEHVTTGPNTDMTITHSLGRIPQGYLVMSKSAACDLYTGSVVATTTQITLRATVSGVTLQIFIF
jgi:hypothetical protein